MQLFFKKRPAHLESLLVSFEKKTIRLSKLVCLLSQKSPICVWLFLKSGSVEKNRDLFQKGDLFLKESEQNG